MNEDLVASDKNEKDFLAALDDLKLKPILSSKHTKCTDWETPFKYQMRRNNDDSMQ